MSNKNTDTSVELLCAMCGSPLDTSKLIPCSEHTDSLFCDDCARLVSDHIYTECVVMNGKPYPVLSDRVMEHIKEEYEDIVTNSRLVNRCGKLESLSQTENNAVIVIAIPDGDDDAVSPQLDLIESDRELRRYAKAAEHLQRPVHSRDSRLSNRSFVFFKTDDAEDTKNRLPKLIRHLEFSYKKDRPVYIERIAAGVKKGAPSWVLTAPSGCGKTEFMHAVEEFLAENNIPIPVIRQDLSQVTETGYKGKNVNSFIDQIKRSTSSSINNAAICFLDEADKKMLASYDSKGINVNAAAQSNLLNMLEGDKTDDTDDKPFDTSNVMFILMGAFQPLRDEKKRYGEMLDELNYCDESMAKTAAEHFFEDITQKEMIDFGMLEELAGRLRTVVNFNSTQKFDRDKDSLVIDSTESISVVKSRRQGGKRKSSLAG